jgi:hypothetical protein
VHHFKNQRDKGWKYGSSGRVPAYEALISSPCPISKTKQTTITTTKTSITVSKTRITI